jgi:predicted secreted protein
MKTWNFLPCLFGMLLFAQCTNTEPSTTAKPTPTNPVGLVAPPDKKKTAVREVVQMGCTSQLTIVRGQILTVKLPATSGTGYLWHLNKPDTHVKLNQSDVLKYEKAEKTATGKVGGSQYQVVSLEALQTGVATLDWVYSRPTDAKNVSNKCSMQVTIQE